MNGDNELKMLLYTQDQTQDFVELSFDLWNVDSNNWSGNLLNPGDSWKLIELTGCIL